MMIKRKLIFLMLLLVYGKLIFAQDFVSDMRIASQTLQNSDLAFLLSYKMFSVSGDQTVLVDQMDVNGCLHSSEKTFFNKEYVSWHNQKYVVSINHSSQTVIVSDIKNYDKNRAVGGALNLLDDSAFAGYQKILLKSEADKRYWRLTPLKSGGAIAFYDIVFDETSKRITSMGILFNITYKDYFGQSPKGVSNESAIKLVMDFNYRSTNTVKCFQIEDWLHFKNDDVFLNQSHNTYKLQKLFRTKQRK